MVKQNDRVSWPAEWGEVRVGVVVDVNGEWCDVAPCDGGEWEQMPVANVSVVEEDR